MKLKRKLPNLDLEKKHKKTPGDLSAEAGGDYLPKLGFKPPQPLDPLSSALSGGAARQVSDVGDSVLWPQVTSLQEEKLGLSAENDRLQDRLQQAENVDDPR